MRVFEHLAAAGDPRTTLASFDLKALERFTHAGQFDKDADPRYHLFYVGRDDVHGVLKYLLARASISLKFNMFGYDDDELHAIIMRLVGNPHVLVQGTLDRSQAGGVHERKLIEQARATNEHLFASSFAIGQSDTHQISHTKGGVIDAKVGWEGSTNWSTSGEGTFVEGATTTGGTGYKAQNNTLMVFTDRVACAEFAARLDTEHIVAVNQQVARGERSV